MSDRIRDAGRYFPPSLQGQQHSFSGKEVLVIVAGAEIRAQDATVWKSWFGEVHTVVMVRDDWLWIRHAVPLDEAVKRFSGEPESHQTHEAHHRRGFAFMSPSQYEKAVQDFLQVIPHKAGPYVNRANEWQETGD